MKNAVLAITLLGVSSLAYAGVQGTEKGLQGCEIKKLVVSIPTVDKAKSVEICHVNGLTFNLKYGAIGKPEIDFNFMGLKSGGFIGEGNGAVAFAIKGDYKYTLTVGKEISEFVVEYKKGNRYQKVEQARLVNSLDNSKWEYWEKFMTNTNYKANNIEPK